MKRCFNCFLLLSCILAYDERALDTNDPGPEEPAVFEEVKMGDCLNEIVLIGENMDQAGFETRLRECLYIDSEETYLVNGGKFSDTWPL